jgi:hypothetical protein
VGPQGVQRQPKCLKKRHQRAPEPLPTASGASRGGSQPELVQPF